MKIIGFSNYNLENVSEFIKEENLDMYAANRKCKELNDKVKENDSYYYKVVADDYKLYIWEP